MKSLGSYESNVKPAGKGTFIHTEEVKVKESRYRPGVAQRFPGVLGS